MPRTVNIAKVARDGDHDMNLQINFDNPATAGAPVDDDMKARTRIGYNDDPPSGTTQFYKVSQFITAGEMVTYLATSRKIRLGILDLVVPED